MENYKSQMNEMVTCSECGVKVHVDDAEASYNAELDDVFFYCSKCINDPAYLPAVSDDSDEAVEQSVQSDLLVCPTCQLELSKDRICPKCFGQYPASR
jgi:ribosomal protein L32